MNAIRNMTTAVRQRVFHRTVRQKTRTLDPVVRTALAEDIEQDENDLATELQQVEVELEQAKASLAQAEEKETFLGQRSRQYRVALDERAAKLREEHRQLELAEQQQEEPQEQEGFMNNENEKDDVENAPLRERAIELEQRTEKWERDEDALQMVVTTHMNILAECERMRRKIKELETKREYCRSMATEVDDFLVAAAAAATGDQEGGRGADNEHNYMAVVASSVSQHVQQPPEQQMTTLNRSINNESE